MFTGLIEEVGTVSQSKAIGNGREFVIDASDVLSDVKIDDSISVDGCCLTVVAFNSTSFKVQAVAETLSKTTLGTFEVGTKVNLERAVRVSDRLGGHIVQGHVDGVGVVNNRVVRGEPTLGVELWISFDPSFGKWLIPVGSVCVNGISLTVADLQEDKFKVAIIPHTIERTNIGLLKVGDKVNLEFDVLAKYIEKLTSN